MNTRLVLSRYVGESIVIYSELGGPTITITVVGRGMARLAFDAPKAVHIDREEIYRRKLEEAVSHKKGAP